MLWRKEKESTTTRQDKFSYPARYCDLYISDRYKQILFVPLNRVITMRACFILLLALTSCTVPDKSSLKVLRETRKSGKSPVTLKAYKKGKETEDQLELRENNSFLYRSRVLGTQKIVIYAGTFTKNGDTLFLSFHDDHKDSLWTGAIIVDTIKKELTLLSKDANYNKQLPIVKP